jgi:aminoglycoside phosphotransferase (APT) family kinase protein
MAAWVEEVLGGALSSCVRTPGGGSRQSYFVRVTATDGQQTAAVLREEAGGSFTGTEINVAKEATVYRSLASTSVPVPAVLGVAPGGAAVLLEMLSGDSGLGDTPDQQNETLTDFMRVVADLHCLDVDQLHLPGFRRPSSTADHAVLDLQMWAGLGDSVPDLDPLVRYAGAYLIAHPPSQVSRTSLVQGDTGPGNFLAESGHVVGLCDMEFAHIGDPMDDIAWITMRAGRLVADLAPYLDEYTRRSGLPILRTNVDYYALAVQYRCAVTTSLAVARGGGARGWPPYLLVTERYIRGIAAELSSLTGVPDTPVALPDPVPTTRTPWYDALLQGIRAGVRGIAAEALRESTRNHQILVHYLRAYDRLGPEIEALEAADARHSLGLEGSHVDKLGQLAHDAGTAGDEAVLSYLLRRARRQAGLWLTLLQRP